MRVYNDVGRMETHENSTIGTGLLSERKGNLQVQEAQEIGKEAQEVRGLYAEHQVAGRIAVLFRKRNKDDSIFYVPDWVKEEKAEFGGIRETRWCHVLFSEFDGIEEGDVAAVYLDARCLIKDSNDDPRIPNEYEVRIYGVQESVMDCVAGIWHE